MPKIKTIFKVRGIVIEIASGTVGEGSNAKILSLSFEEPVVSITDMVKASLLIQKQLSDKAAKAKRKAKAKDKAAEKKDKARKAGKSKVIAQARAPRKPKTLVQTTMFEEGPGDAITPENMAERFPDQATAPLTANSCVMG